MITPTHKVSNPVPLDDQIWEDIIKKYRTDKKNKIVGDYMMDSSLLRRILFIKFSSENVLHAAWFKKPEETEILVLDQTFKIKMPHLVFHVKGSILNVYFTKETPDEKSRLYINPFGNLMGDHICTGTIALPKTTIIPDFIDQWEDVFLKSKFTSLINAHYDLVKGFKSQLEKGKVMMDKLVSANLTIQKIKP